MSAAASYDCAPRSSLSGVALAAVQAALVAPVRAGGTYVALSKEWLDAFSRGCASAADLSVNDGDERLLVPAVIDVQPWLRKPAVFAGVVEPLRLIRGEVRGGARDAAAAVAAAAAAAAAAARHCAP
jgi:hypothetical protein